MQMSTLGALVNSTKCSIPTDLDVLILDYRCKWQNKTCNSSLIDSTFTALGMCAHINAGPIQDSIISTMAGERELGSNGCEIGPNIS